MTTLDESTIVAQSAEDGLVRSGAQAWQLGIVTDRAGHVHLGAVVAGAGAEPHAYIDLLAPLGADDPGKLDFKQLVVLATGQELADLRRLAQRCIEDARLKRRLVQLADLAAS